MGGRVASMLELGAGFHPDFTGRENVYMNAAIQGLSRREVDARMDAIVAFSELEAFIDNPVRTYSSGMYTRLGFAVASHVNSDVLLLDEVLAVGDEAFQRKCLGRVFEYRRAGGTVVFVSHDAEAVERVCDRAVLLEHGELAAEGRPGDVLATYRRALVRGEEPGRRGEPAPSEASDEWGTRTVAITAVRTVGPDGAADRFASGGPLLVEIDFQARERVATPVFGVEIRAVDGTLCYGTNTRRDTYPVESVEGRGTATFAIERLPLHEGRFLLTVAVHLGRRERGLPLDRPPLRAVGVRPHRRRGPGAVRRPLVGERGAQRRRARGSRWMAEPPVVDVDALVEDLRERVARARREGLYADDLSGQALRAPAPEARVRFRPELAYSTKPVVGRPLTAVKKALLRLLVHVFDDLARQADAGIAAAEAAARDARSWAQQAAEAEASARERVAADVAALAGRVDGLEAPARAPAGAGRAWPGWSAAGRAAPAAAAAGAPRRRPGRRRATRASTTSPSRRASAAPRRPCASARRSTAATSRAGGGPSTSAAGAASCWS